MEESKIISIIMILLTFGTLFGALIYIEYQKMTVTNVDKYIDNGDGTIYFPYDNGPIDSQISHYMISHKNVEVVRIINVDGSTNNGIEKAGSFVLFKNKTGGN